MEWYYILGIISYGIFILQFCLSFLFGGDTDADIDVDFDGDADLSFSDLISFKGLVHFLMGMSGWLMLQGNTSWLSIVFSIFTGVCFTVFLALVYKLALRLQSIPTKKSGIDLVGESVTICLTMESISEKHCIATICNGGVTEEINCVTSTLVKVGDKRIILDYKNGIYHIS